MPYLDDQTLDSIEADLAAAHQSLAHGEFDMKDATKTGVKILEVVVPAAAFSYLNGRSAAGEVKIGPVPLDLGVGLALTLLSMFDVAGGYEDDLLNIGLGALAAYGARTGAAFGHAALTAAGTTTTTSGFGSGEAAHDNVGSRGWDSRLGNQANRSAAEARRMMHHVSGNVEISGAMRPGSPVPPGTQRFVVQQIG